MYLLLASVFKIELEEAAEVAGAISTVATFAVLNVVPTGEPKLAGICGYSNPTKYDPAIANTTKIPRMYLVILVSADEVIVSESC